MIKILIISDIAFSGENLIKGLNKKKGFDVNFYKNIKWSGNKKHVKGFYNIVLVNSPNYKKFLVLNNVKYDKLIVFYHGSDLRLPYKSFPVYNYFLKKGDFFLYSTIDLPFWLRKIPDNKKMLFRVPIDTDIFKPITPFEDRKKGYIWGKGVLEKKDLIPHEEVPKLLNKYKEITVYPDCGLSPYLLSVSALESASCGCKVTHHPYLNRDWVKKNASIESQTDKFIKIIDRVLDGFN